MDHHGKCCKHNNILITAKEGASLPEYSSHGAAGADLRAYLKQDLILNPGDSTLVPTGLRMSIPQGYEVQIRPRSGLALNNQITVLNTPGTIDSDYRGEVGVILINHGKEPFVIKPGMRIAQMIFVSVLQASFSIVENLETTARGAGGFGHTGLN